VHERTTHFTVHADLTTCLNGHTQHGDDLLDRWDGSTLVRTTPDPLHEGRVALALTLRTDGPHTHVRATAAADRPLSVHDVRALATAQFRLPNGELDQLCTADRRANAALARYRSMGLLRTPDLLHAAARIVTAQQIHGRLALRLRRELVQRFGTTVPVGGHRAGAIDPHQLATTTIDELRAFGCSAAKADTLIRLARLIRDGELCHTSLDPLDTNELITRLQTVPGIGRWSAEWLAIRVFDRDQVVAGDLVVRRAIGWLYGLDEPSERDLRVRTAYWGTASSFAQAAAAHAHRTI
jgi:DNA-3-methyladenine glycosylase II